MGSKLKIVWSDYEDSTDGWNSRGALATLNGEVILDSDAKQLFDNKLPDVDLLTILILALELKGVRIKGAGEFYLNTTGEPYKGENLADEDIKHTLDIEWSSDSYDCDDCGTSWAIGASVLLDGVKIVDKEAHAHCYDGSGDVDIDGIFLIALEKLGVLVEDGESDTQWSKNTCYDYFINAKEDIEYIKL